MKTISKTNVDLLIESMRCGDFTPDPELTPELVEILEYFKVTESLTSISYAPLVRCLPAYRYKFLQEFVDQWELEEEKHGQVLKLYLQKHGHSALIKPSETLSLRYKLKVLWMIIMSWPLWFVSTGVYLIVGTVNEATTSAGYWALMKRAENYPLLSEIITAIQAEEVCHLNSYSNNAPKFLEKTKTWKLWLAQLILPYVLKPIGSDHGDMTKLVRLLLAGGRDSGFYPRLQSYLDKANKTLSGSGDIVLRAIQKIELST